MLSQQLTPEKSVLSISFKINPIEVQLGKELGRGGYGVVYVGTWRHNEVAVKQLLIDKMSSESVKELERESQIMAQLHSPNIVQFYGFYISPAYSIVMEYMPNSSLFRMLGSDQPLEWSLRLNIALDISKGVVFLHHENILHRDLKSMNVLLDKTYQAKLTDFGLSKVKTETKSHAIATKTSSKDSVGTLQWMAPELFERKAIFTQKSDIYSLGVTLWELSSRKIPFADAPNPQIIPMWVQKGDREDIPENCPPALGTVIQQCWAGEPKDRPDADKVVGLLKEVVLTSIDISSVTATTTLSSSAMSKPNYLSNVPTMIASFPKPQDNISSESHKPMVFSPQGKEVLQASMPSISAQVMPLKQSFQVDAKELNTFLRLVAEGEQDQAENLLKKTPELSFPSASSDVTDLSGRIFKGITGFQYAVWALDWHMWTMLRKYIPLEAQREQIQALSTGSWVQQHGRFASWQSLLNALQKAIDLYQSERWEEGDETWQKQVGGAQLLLPVHVINQYCNILRNNSDITFTSVLSRTRKTDKGEWFTANYNNGKIGDTCAVMGFSSDPSLATRAASVMMKYYGVPGCFDRVIDVSKITYDLESCRVLLNTRTQQCDQLLAELAVPRPQTDIKELNTFLRLVAEGEQDQAKNLLKKTPELALASSDVTDLSGRTFKDITGFQYAVWALDWHMWSMIKQYMSDEAIREQLKGVENGAWVNQYGKSSTWQNLVAALDQQVTLLNASKWNDAAKQWQVRVGRAQRQLPAHVVNEYCHPSRSFERCPDFMQGAELARTRLTYGDKEWFTQQYKGQLGEKFAYLRGSMAMARAEDFHSGATYVIQDRDASRALLAARTQQRDQLVAEYVPRAKVVKK